MTKRSRYFTSNLLSQGGCNALYIDKQQKNHSCKIGNLQVSNKIIRKKGFSAKNKIHPKKKSLHQQTKKQPSRQNQPFSDLHVTLYYLSSFLTILLWLSKTRLFLDLSLLSSLSGLSKDYQIWSSPHKMSKSVKDIFPPNVLKDG